MAELEIFPLERFAQHGAAIKRPVEIAHFSYDEDHNFRLDDSSLKYYYTPQLGISLSDGFETFRKQDDSQDEHLDSLLCTIMSLEKNTGEKVDADIVTWRGMMTKILVAPYSKFDSFEMNATCFQRTVFIEENHEYKLQSLRRQSSKRPRPNMPSQDLMSYWGYKFESLSLIPDTWDKTPRDFIDSRPTHVVSNSAQYCSVVRTSVGQAKLVLGGEVDAIWDRRPADSSQKINWVELKTSAEIRNDADALNFERKLNKFWAQSFLLGVPKIIVGFRTNDMSGKLLRVQEFKTTEIPSLVRQSGNGSWESNVCINFATAFLDLVRNTIQGDGGVWRIRRLERSSRIEIFKIAESGYGQILKQDFVNWRSQLEIGSSKGATVG